MHPIRSSVAVLATLALALGAISPVVVAQEDAAEHPLVGAWIVDTTPQDTSDPTDGITAFLPGGVLVDRGLESTELGAWSPSGERSATVTIFEPASDPEGNVTGFVTIRADLEVAADGQSFSGTYSLEFPAAFSEAFGTPPGELGPGEVTGERLSAEAMGEPAGPLPDFEELFAAPEDGSTSQPSPVVEEMPPVEESPVPEGSPAA